MAITPAESKVVAIAGLLFLLGAGAQRLRLARSANPFDYSLVDSTFDAATLRYMGSAEEEPLAANAAGDDSTGSPADATSAAPTVGGSAPDNDGTAVDINTASAAELQRLPRIGPALAERIIDHRRRYGPFRSVQELARVPGIGSKTVDRLRLMTSVGDTTRPSRH
jgi:competence ComEA-like helix-hairpin-helix protein